MTKLYTADQIDTLGLAIGELVQDKSTETMQEVYRLIEELTPEIGTAVDGKSAYELAVQNGFVGTVVEYLASLKGEKGDTGAKGNTGAKGDKGDKGDTGAAGTNATNETIKNQKTGTNIKVWVGTQAEYDAVTPKDSATLYMVK